MTKNMTINNIDHIHCMTVNPFAASCKLGNTLMDVFMATVTLSMAYPSTTQSPPKRQVFQMLPKRLPALTINTPFGF
jgi:hypothetical protein